MLPLYTGGDRHRVVALTDQLQALDYRSEFRRDYGRLLHSPAFRRLQGKKQLFPGSESDFFRNRLTHSLEVAQIAKGIASRLNRTEQTFHKESIDLDLVEFACLAHDLGHPPFGHNGEEALDLCMRNSGGFEGNAQTLRIITKLEKRLLPLLDASVVVSQKTLVDRRIGLDLTARSIASILKYDNLIPLLGSERNKGGSGPIKGYYQSEKAVIDWVKKCVGFDDSAEFKTLECSIMDVADDIAYSTYDLEDAFKGGFLTPLLIFQTHESIVRCVCSTITRRAKDKYPDTAGGDYQFTQKEFHRKVLMIFNEILPTDHADFVSQLVDSADASLTTASDGHIRTAFTSQLVRTALDNIEYRPNYKTPALSSVRLSFENFQQVEVLKNLVYETLIMSPKLKLTEFRGKDVVTKLFVSLRGEGGHQLMPEDYRDLFETVQSSVDKDRIVCDFIAGMTDRYAVQFYNRLFGALSESIHLPI